jgi:serine/threonine-protein kinase
VDELTGELLGTYRLLEVIGQGGMSTVYKAVDESDDSLVAVKLLSAYIAQEPRFKARFAREVEVLQSLSGGKIVPILGYGEQDAFTYIVMPFLAQGTLHDRLQNGGISLSESAGILNDVSAALQLAHSRGIVHRDVKPSNILLDEAGGAYLSDFGFAYVSESSHSLTGSVLIGTPAFMSPEQCRGETVDERSDQYSLGAVLFLLTTGRLPYDADTPMGMVVKHIHDPLPRPRSFNPYLPDAIEAVIQQAMAKRPEDRYESIEALNQAYQQALSLSLDPDSGLPRPEAIGPLPQTAAMPPLPLPTGSTPLWAKGRTALALAVLAMFAIPLGAWALTGRTPGSGTDGTATLPADLLATIQALSTENASILGAAVGPDQIQTAVAGTLEAMERLGTGQAPTLANLSVFGPTATPTPSPTLGVARTGTAGSGGSGSGSQAGSNPTSTSVPSTGVPDTPAPTPTDGSGPGPTSAPTSPPAATPVPPTAPPPPDTPVPPPPVPTDSGDKCATNPNSPKYCTPPP